MSGEGIAADGITSVDESIEMASAGLSPPAVAVPTPTPVVVDTTDDRLVIFYVFPVKRFTSSYIVINIQHYSKPSPARI
jgi:hypothetical protein